MIDYDIIHNSIEYYSRNTNTSFTRVEVPWTVTEEVSCITKPTGSREFKLVHENGKVLVASAEQSFLYQYLKGFLPPGKFQAVTPCFRFENFDAIHSKYFIKNELIITDHTNADSALSNIVDTAFLFFCKYLPESRLKILKTSDKSYDIMFQFSETSEQYELGSYGIRQCDFLEWVYGTGVAEPRLSAVIKKYELSLKRN